MDWYSSLVFLYSSFAMDVATAWSANGIRVDNTHMRALFVLMCGPFEPIGEKLLCFMRVRCL